MTVIRYLYKHLGKLLFITSIIIVVIFAIFNSVQVGAGTYEFTPKNTTLIAGCKSRIDIMVDPESSASNAADIEIKYDPDEVEILDSIPSFDGIQIKHGNAYEAYFGNIVDPSQGKILLAGASFVSELRSEKTFATIEFRSVEGINTANFEIKFDGFGATLDSNIAESSTSDDLLNSVSNGSYKFVQGSCSRDREPPKIFYENPKAYAKNVPIDTQITIKITDNQSGVDLANTVFLINGMEYRATDPEVKNTGNPLDYTFVITLRDPLPENESSAITVNTQDLAGNKSSSSIVFNIPEAVIEEVICEISDEVPDEETYITNIQNTNFEARLFDSEGIWTTEPIIDSLTLGKNFDTPLKTLQYFSLFALGFLALSLLGALLAFQKRTISGIALLENRNFLKFTSLSVIDLVTKKVVARDITDEYGNYDFQLKPGTYEVVTIDQKIKWKELLIVPMSHSYRILGTNLKELKDQNSKLADFLLWLESVVYDFRVILSEISPGLILAGLAISINNFILYSSLLNLLIMVGFLALILFFYIIPYFVNVVLKVTESTRETADLNDL